MSRTSTVRPVDGKFVKSTLSLRSRSSLNRLNDRVRKILDQFSKDTKKDIDKRSMIRRMFMSSTLEASVFMGKNYSEHSHSINNTRNNLTLKQMFDLFEKLTVRQSEKIFGVTPINWEDSSSKRLSLVDDEEIISLSYGKVFLFTDFVVCLWNPTSNAVWGKNWVGSKIHRNTKLWTRKTGNRWNSSGIFSQESPHYSSSKKSTSSQTKWAIYDNSMDELSSCRCSITSYDDL